MLSRRLRAQCQFGGRSCGARLLCACGGEVCCRRARSWEELCRLLAHLVGGDLLAWLRCFVLLVRLTGSAGELSFAFALFRRKFKNKLILPPMTMRCSFHRQHPNSTSMFLYVFHLRACIMYAHHSAMIKTIGTIVIANLPLIAEFLTTNAAGKRQDACLQHPTHKKLEQGHKL